MFKLCLGLCKKHTFPVCPIKQAFRFSVCSQMGTGELKFSAWSLLLEDGPLVCQLHRAVAGEVVLVGECSK